jgi:hypothetical protein
VLLRVRLLHIALGHLLHHKVSINLYILDQLAVFDAPLSGDGQGTDRGLGIDERVDSILDIRERELVCGLILSTVSIMIIKGTRIRVSMEMTELTWPIGFLSVTAYVAWVAGSPDSNSYETKAGHKALIMSSWLWRAARTCSTVTLAGMSVVTLVVDILSCGCGLEGLLGSRLV